MPRSPPRHILGANQQLPMQPRQQMASATNRGGQNYTWAQVVNALPLVANKSKMANTAALFNNVRKPTAVQPNRQTVPAVSSIPLRKYPQVTLHPDDFIASGAWLFDLSHAPQWFIQEVMKKDRRGKAQDGRQGSSRREFIIQPNEEKPQGVTQAVPKVNPGRSMKPVARPPVQRAVVNDESVLASGAWLFDLASAPLSFQNEVRKQSSRALGKQGGGKLQRHEMSDENSFLESGLWLFNLSHAPLWFQTEVKGSKQAAASIHRATQQHNHRVGQPHQGEKKNLSVRTHHEEEEFEFCSWLLDPAHSPEWFKRHLSPSSPTHAALPNKRPWSAPEKKVAPKAAPIRSQTPMPRVTPARSYVKAVNAHPDEAFFSGAWLFDPKSRPSWLQEALQSRLPSQLKSQKAPVVAPPIVQGKRQILSQNHVPAQPIHMAHYDPDVAFYSGAWLFDRTVRPSWLQAALQSRISSQRKSQKMPVVSPTVVQVKRQVISHNKVPAQPIRMAHYDPDVVFYSGAWLFDRAARPAWLQEALQSRILSQAKSQKMPVVAPTTVPSKEQIPRQNKVISQNKVPAQPIRMANYDPDTVFYSGAWLFDRTVRPSWLQEALQSRVPTQPRSQKLPVASSIVPPRGQVARLNKVPAQPIRVAHYDPDIVFYSGAWLFDRTARPVWLQNELIKKRSVASRPVEQRPKATPSAVPSRSSSPTARPTQKPQLKPQPEDIGFESGAWLFDEASAPVWLGSCLRSVPTKPAQRSKLGSPRYARLLDTHKNVALPPTPQKMVKPQSEDLCLESGNWLFSLSEAPAWFQRELKRPVKAQPMQARPSPGARHPRSTVKASTPKPIVAEYDPDDAFYSGAWLFDPSVAPHWLRSQVYPFKLDYHPSTMKAEVRSALNQHRYLPPNRFSRAQPPHRGHSPTTRAVISSSRKARNAV